MRSHSVDFLNQSVLKTALPHSYTVTMTDKHMKMNGNQRLPGKEKNTSKNTEL